MENQRRHDKRHKENGFNSLHLQGKFFQYRQKNAL